MTLRLTFNVTDECLILTLALALTLSLTLNVTSYTCVSQTLALTFYNFVLTEPLMLRLL